MRTRKAGWVVFLAVAGFAGLTGSVRAGISERESVALTVYNQDFALVREERRIELKKGQSEVSLEEVPALIDPTSVHFASLTAPDAVRILEQNYEYDLVSYGKLLNKYVGREIEIHQVADQKTGEVRVAKAKLLSSGYFVQPQPYGYGASQLYQYGYSGQTLFEIEGKIHTAAGGTIVLPKLPEELILKPVLSWQIESAKAGEHTIELSYMTSGIKWMADYVALVNTDDTRLDFTGWVTLDNRSGSAYENARLKLMAGDVNVAAPASGLGKVAGSKPVIERMKEGLPFEEKTFFEYHLYTLDRPATVKDQETKQIEFIRSGEIPITKRYIYDGFQVGEEFRGWGVDSYRERPDYGAAGHKKVWVYLEFKNSEANHLGMPLPKGRVRVYKRDEDKSQEFVGEDLIDHTPKDEELKLYAGNAFDLVGERKQTDFKVIESGHIVEETFEITLRNHKKEDVTITVREQLYRGWEWEIRGSSHPFEKKDAQLIEISLKVPKDGQVKLTYTVRYRW